MPHGKKPDLPEVLFFHTVSIEQYGGSEGVRDEESLLAAIEGPGRHLSARSTSSLPSRKPPP